MSDFWKDYEPEPSRPAPVREDWGPGPHEVHSLPPALPVQDFVAQCTVDVSGAAGPSCEPLNWHKTAAQRQWVGLTEDEIDEIFDNWPTYNLEHFEFAKVVEAKIFEKNGTTAVVIPDALNPKDENPAYAAGWNDCRAEMLKGMKP